MFTLDNFEKKVDSKILDRGFEYYEQNYVRNLSQVSRGVFEAFVRGTERYKVTIKLKDRTVTEHLCTCPYDWGDVCKHEVAVLYYIRDSQWEEDDNEYDRFKRMMQKVSEKDFAEFLKDHFRASRSFCKAFFERFGKKK